MAGEGGGSPAPAATRGRGGPIDRERGATQGSVQVHIRCRVCRRVTKRCVTLEADIPDRLRCEPNGATAPGQEVRCANCGRLCFETMEDARHSVRAAVQNGWTAHLEEGAVVLDR